MYIYIYIHIYIYIYIYIIYKGYAIFKMILPKTILIKNIDYLNLYV